MTTEHDSDSYDEHDDQAWVADLLNRAATPSGLTETSPTMPDAVWAKLEATIAAEQQARETPMAAKKPKRRIGLYALAASAALVVGGAVLVATLDRSPAPAPVAAPTGEPAAVQVLASGTDYTATGLTNQLSGMLKSGLGLSKTSDLSHLALDTTPTEGTTGVTASTTAEHQCLASLTGNEQAQALVLDRATVMGQDAVIIVMQASEATNPTIAPTAEIQTKIGPVHVWAVAPDCTPLNLTPATVNSSLNW